MYYLDKDMSVTCGEEINQTKCKWHKSFRSMIFVYRKPSVRRCFTVSGDKECMTHFVFLYRFLYR